MTYLTLKLVHIVSSTFLFGTGLGSAFYMYRANQKNDLQVMYFAAKNVVVADWLFTTPSVIVQPVTGFLLIAKLGYPLSSPWIIISLGLYVIAGICWLPVVWLQIRMRDMLKLAIESHQPLNQLYHIYMRRWFLLGWPAFISVIIIFGLMVFKPM